MSDEKCGGNLIVCMCVCSEERQLKQRIRELNLYRKNGITKAEGQCHNRRLLCNHMDMEKSECFSHLCL